MEHDERRTMQPYLPDTCSICSFFIKKWGYLDGYYLFFIKLTIIFISPFVKRVKVSRNTFVIVAYEKVLACNRVAMENWTKEMPRHYTIKNEGDMPSTLTFI